MKIRVQLMVEWDDETDLTPEEYEELVRKHRLHIVRTLEPVVMIDELPEPGNVFRMDWIYSEEEDE